MFLKGNTAANPITIRYPQITQINFLNLCNLWMVRFLRKYLQQSDIHAKLRKLSYSK